MRFRLLIRFSLDLIKRIIIDIARKKSNLMTTVDIVLKELVVRGLLPNKIQALELFGMYGLWFTKDYLDSCHDLEFWECDPHLITLAKIALTNKNVDFIAGDSIRATCDGLLRKKMYNFVALDNPARIFGEYCEHFDVLPSIWKYLDPAGSIILFNVCYDPELYFKRRAKKIDQIWLEKRKLYYGIDPSMIETKLRISWFEEFYRKQVPSHIQVDFLRFYPRTTGVGLISMAISANKK